MLKFRSRHIKAEIFRKTKSSEVTRKRLQSPGEGAGSEKSQLSLFRFAGLSALLNSRETSGGSAAAHYAVLRVKARRGRGGGGERDGTTARPPSCLRPRSARAPFSVTHASPSPPPRPGLCIARRRSGAGAAAFFARLRSRGL